MMCEEWTPLEGFENLVFLGMNGKPISERAFQVTLDGIEKAINKEDGPMHWNRGKCHSPWI